MIRMCLLTATLLLFPLVPASAADLPEAESEDIVYLGDSQPLLLRLHVLVDGKPLQTAWDEAMDALFRIFDRDGDGVLSKQEAAQVPPPSVLFNPFSGPLAFQASTPAVLLTSGKGKTSRQELVEYFRHGGASCFNLRSIGGNPWGGYAFVAPGQLVVAGGSPQQADGLNQRIFALLDTDRDGKLSEKELADAPTLLARLDRDDSETLSQAELQSIPSTVPVRVQFSAPLSAGPIQKATGSFLRLKTGAAERTLGKRLLALYGNKDGQPARQTLRRRDLALSADAFNILDHDHNGTLDLDELATFSQRPADIELTLRLGKRGKNEPPIEQHRTPAPTALTRSLRRLGPDALAFDVGVAHLELHCAASSAGRTSQRQVRVQYQTLFDMADADKNGYLEPREVENNGFFRFRFSMMDRNHDGKVFFKEVQAYLDEMDTLQNLAQASGVTLQVQDQGQSLFSLVDTNHDGQLGLRELRNMRRLAGRLDRDGDGLLATSELPRSYRLDVARGQQMQPAYQSGRVIRFAVDGATSAAPPAAPGRPLWFHKMDRNGDGDVSPREFLGTAEQFRRLDTDEDGLISLDEARQADSTLRQAGAGQP